MLIARIIRLALVGDVERAVRGQRAALNVHAVIDVGNGRTCHPTILVGNGTYNVDRRICRRSQRAAGHIDGGAVVGSQIERAVHGDRTAAARSDAQPVSRDRGHAVQRDGAAFRTDGSAGKSIRTADADRGGICARNGHAAAVGKNARGRGAEHVDGRHAAARNDAAVRVNAETVRIGEIDGAIFGFDRAARNVQPVIVAITAAAAHTAVEGEIDVGKGDRASCSAPCCAPARCRADARYIGTGEGERNGAFRIRACALHVEPAAFDVDGGAVVGRRFVRGVLGERAAVDLHEAVREVNDIAALRIETAAADV